MTRVFQILINEKDSTELPPRVANISQQLINSFPAGEYSLWTNKLIENFLRDQFHSEVLDAYQSLIPYAYKSDLARYCLLFHFGGWYFDLGIQIEKNYVFEPVGKDLDLIFFWDLGDVMAPWRSFYDCMNGIIYSSPGNPILKTAIQMVVENCRNQYYGTDSMCPTGPGVLGRAIAVHGKTDRHYDGHFLQLTPQHNQKNRAYVLRDGTIMAWHRTRINAEAESLADLGLEGTNNYRDLWANRKVYSNHR